MRSYIKKMIEQINIKIYNNVKYFSVRDIIKNIDNEEKDDYYIKTIFSIVGHLECVYDGTSSNILDILFLNSTSALKFTYHSEKKTGTDLIKILSY